MCLLADLTLMLAWTPEEAGKIVETYKLFENKPPDLIMARAQQYPHQKVRHFFTNHFSCDQICFQNIDIFGFFPVLTVGYSSYEHKARE